MTGFNLPPGCTTKHIEDLWNSGPCECCGEHDDNCICTQCPICQQYGNPQCYVRPDAMWKGHGLEYTTQQLIGQTRRKIEDLEEQIQDHKLYIDWLEEEEHLKTLRGPGGTGDIPF